MILLTITIIALLYLRKYFPTHIKTINIVTLVLSIWLITGFTIKQFTSSGHSRTYTDVQMAQNLINDDKEFKKAKMKVLDDGSVKITLKRKKYLLKNGVLSNYR